MPTLRNKETDFNVSPFAQASPVAKALGDTVGGQEVAKPVITQSQAAVLHQRLE
tara:strand:- start:7 stop:168 length:162 start_codon:yes stop_codon:yes gene_type:complete